MTEIKVQPMDYNFIMSWDNEELHEVGEQRFTLRYDEEKEDEATLKTAGDENIRVPVYDFLQALERLIAGQVDGLPSKKIKTLTIVREGRPIITIPECDKWNLVSVFRMLAKVSRII